MWIFGIGLKLYLTPNIRLIWLIHDTVFTINWTNIGFFYQDV
jgi:hypothetical protein